MDLNHLCMGCMENKGKAELCPHCGWKQGTVPESFLHLPPGTVLGEKYLLGRVLGQGGFGITYLAWDIYLDRKLAVKEYFPRELCFRESGYSTVSVHSKTMWEQYEYGLGKFLAEGKTLARFDGHPNIVSVRDYFEANETAYLVMNYLEGVTLGDYLKLKGSSLSFQETLQIMTPVLDALTSVHEAGMLHRDISPDNIMITVKKRVMILDFGAARHAIGEKGKKFSVIIKPGYAPEEQYRSGGVQGPWTDIYAAAATMYRCITGEMPPDSLDRLSSDSLVPPSQQGVEIQPEEEEVLLKALSVRSSDRFQSVVQFQESLLAASRQVDTVVTEQEAFTAPYQDLEPGEPVSSPEEMDPPPVPASHSAQEYSPGDSSTDVTINIGRSQDNHLVLSDSTVSRYHASVFYQAGRWYITDRDSTHGTYVNNTPVQNPVELVAGDRVHFSQAGAVFDGVSLISNSGERLINLQDLLASSSQRAGGSGKSSPASEGSRFLLPAAVLGAGILILGLAVHMFWGGGDAELPANFREDSAGAVSEIKSEEEEEEEEVLEYGSIEFEGGIYTGELKDGKPHGFGALVYRRPAVPGGDRKYEGYWREGEMHGEGTMTYPGGYTRTGIWENNVMLSD